VLPDERRAAIIDLLQQVRSISNAELAERFGVSLDTIRRDLRALTRAGFVVRTHGGAVWSDTREVTFRLHRDPMLAAKRAIARKAIDFVRPGETLALDMGTTVTQLARVLTSAKRRRAVSAYTVDLRIAMILAKDKEIRAHVIGGLIGERNYLSGPLAHKVIEGLAFDTLFLAASGVSPGAGITEPLEDVAEVKRALVARAKRIILLVDQGKFGKQHESVVAPLEVVDVLITNRTAPRTVLEQIEPLGVACVRA